MIPEEMLAAAAALRASAPRAARGCWHRACAFLTRMALEEAITEHVVRRYPTAAAARTSSKLVCLRTVVPEQTALDAISAWNELSRACHLHPYELAPTAAELRRWAEIVTRILLRSSE